jgi:hypothetical protein
MCLLTFTFVTIAERCPQDLISAVYLVINRLGPAHLGLEVDVARGGTVPEVSQFGLQFQNRFFKLEWLQFHEVVNGW